MNYRDKVAELLGVELRDVNLWPDRLEIDMDYGPAITFQKLQQLSELVGTDKIDLKPREPGWGYSIPAKIVVYLC